MPYSSETLDQCADRIVRQEVMCCLSSIVSTLAGGYGITSVQRKLGASQNDSAGEAITSLIEQAFELASPVANCEEAAIQAGWRKASAEELSQDFWPCQFDPEGWQAETWQDACEQTETEPYEREVFEHWAVTQWLADKLREHGEKVDDDFGGLVVWARTTTGQGIAMDSVIREIAKAIVTPAPSKPRSWTDAIVRGVPSQAAWRAAIAPKT